MKTPIKNNSKIKILVILLVQLITISNSAYPGITRVYNKTIAYAQKGPSDTTTINVKDAGAKGDGSSDDYAAITQVLSQGNGPVKVYFPAGNYLILKALVTTHDGTVFSFSSNAKLIIPANNLDGGIQLKNNNCKVIGANILGNGVSSTDIVRGYGILLFGVSNCRVLNCTFDKVSGINIFLLNNGTNGCKQCTIKGNTITEPAFDRKIVQDAAGIMAGYSGTGYFHENNLIANNTVDGNETLAHGIAFITHAKGNTITRNTVKNCLRYGIVAYESSYEDFKLQNTTITYNDVENIGTPNAGPSPYGMGIYLMKSHYSIVRSNKVNNCNLNTDNSETLPSGSIAINGATYCTVDGNVITNAHRYGIAISMAFHSNITNNTIDHSGESGIYLINTAFNVIKGNTIKNVTAYGIKGLFGNLSRPNYAAQMKIPDYQNLSTGQGVEITRNKIYSSSATIIRLYGEDPDPKTNYNGNRINNMYIHGNTIIGNSNPNSINLSNVQDGGNKVSNNKFQ
jgi:parallel beta-helix repeat protein